MLYKEMFSLFVYRKLHVYSTYFLYYVNMGVYTVNDPLFNVLIKTSFYRTLWF